MVKKVNTFFFKMPVCESCTSGISNKSPGLQCTGACRKFYHGKCVEINKQDLNKFLMHGVRWLCPCCRDVTNQTSIVIGTEGNDIDMESVPSSVTFILKDIQENLRSLNKKHEDVMESVNFCSNQISTFETVLNKMNEKIASLEKVNRENANLKIEVSQLHTKVDLLEQQTRANNLEIQGVPFKENENLLNILYKIGEHVKCPIAEVDIDTVYRVTPHPSSAQQMKPIIVKLLTKHKRDSILAATKILRRESNTPGIAIDNISKKLFINEHLTSKIKLLLKHTKEAAKSKNFKFVWVRNGNILVRKDDRSKVISIGKEGDILKLQ